MNPRIHPRWHLTNDPKLLAPLFAKKGSGAACWYPLPDEGETTTSAYTLLHTGGMVLPSFGRDVGLLPGTFLNLIVFCLFLWP